MSAERALAVAPPSTARVPTEATLEAIARKLDELSEEVAELRANAQAIASAAGDAMQAVQSGGLLGMLGFGKG